MFSSRKIIFSFLIFILLPAILFSQTDTTKWTIQQERNYNSILNNADRCMRAKDYVNAKTFYINALAAKPGAQYPKDQVATCNYNTAAASPYAKDSLWPEFLQQADSVFASKDYDAALQWYKVAIDFNSTKNPVAAKKFTRTKFIVDSLDDVKKYPPIEFWPNGNKKIERTSKKIPGTFHFKSYNENGILLAEGEFLDGKKNGTYCEYYPNGKKSVQLKYSKGKVKKEKHWDENGKSVKKSG